ncbi:MAG: hypothetical protein R1F52_07885 [Candidatus Nitrosoabyssus spongiisocia]|nr:MAG: hypothetical protein R1F52_07885 [Nitrosopumilaceae archaeon AB1(1)]
MERTQVDMKDVKTVFIERLDDIYENMNNRNYEASSRISHDLVNFSWNLELEDEVFISEILESVSSNLIGMFRNYSVPKEIEIKMNSEILSELKSVMGAYPNKNPSTLYACLKQLRYTTTLHQLTIWQKFDKSRKRILRMGDEF